MTMLPISPLVVVMMIVHVLLIMVMTVCLPQVLKNYHCHYHVSAFVVVGQHWKVLNHQKKRSRISITNYNKQRRGFNQAIHFGRYPLFLNVRQQQQEALYSSTSSQESTPEISVQTTNSNDDNHHHDETKRRQELLKTPLELLGINPKELHDATLQSIQDPSLGYNQTFGKSAIKTYRSFLFSTKNKNIHAPQQQQAAAQRCANHISFLMKRHESRQAEWIRHIDPHYNNNNETTTTPKRRVFSLVLVLDNVRSAFNVGSLFRTADAAGCSHVFTTGITPRVDGAGAEKLQKSALGAQWTVPSRHFTTLTDALQYIKSNFYNYTTYALETTSKSQVYTSISYPKPPPITNNNHDNNDDDNVDTANKGGGVVLVLGNEVTGIPVDILQNKDLVNGGVIEIPMYGMKNSLNIAACAPIVLYEILRQWNQE